jgi:RHS repeat-associated protein
VVWSATYDAFGKATVHTGSSISNNLRFPGQYYDQETGLHYNWNRYYDPTVGRYTTSDPIGLEGGINMYAYVDSNPVHYYDPYGLLSMDPIWGAIWNSTGWDGTGAVADAVVGFGDSASLNITSLIRDAAGIEGGVDKCSNAYKAGSWVAFAFGGGRLAYAGLAKGYSKIASSGAEASAFRSRLRVIFGGGKNLRPPNLLKYDTDDLLRLGAGRTNKYANLYGAGVAATGAYKGSGCGC